MDGWKRKPTYMGDYYMDLCVRAGCERGPGHLELAVAPEARAQAAELLARLGIPRDAELVGLCPGASFGSSKLWPPERFAAAGDALALRRGVSVVVFHGPGEERLAGAVQKHMRCGAPLIGRDFALFKALVERCSLLIGTDSGHRHFAVALGRPVLVLMGPTSRAYTDGNLEKQKILQKEVPCGPCQKKACPTGDHRCMQAITVEEVVAAAEEILGPRRPAAVQPRP
jgi:heptosyltransferase-2